MKNAAVPPIHAFSLSKVERLNDVRSIMLAADMVKLRLQYLHPNTLPFFVK
jgi:hypothetical protein